MPADRDSPGSSVPAVPVPLPTGRSRTDERAPVAPNSAQTGSREAGRSEGPVVRRMIQELEKQKVDPVDEAVKWLHGKDWPIDRDRIIDPALTPGTCHQLTFDNEESYPSSQLGVIEEWRGVGKPRILVCFKGERLGHTATYDEKTDDWRQTLPDGPTFRCSRDEVEKWGGYTRLLDTGIEEELRELLAPEEEAILRWDSARTELLKLCEASVERDRQKIKPRNEETYLVDWSQKASEQKAYSAENLDDIENWLGQIKEIMESW